MRRLALLGLLLLTACGSPLAAAPTATPAPTPTPVWARYTVGDITQAFQQSGLRVEPITLDDGHYFPNRPPVGTAYDFLHVSSTVINGTIVILATPGDLATWLNYLPTIDKAYATAVRYQAHGNTLLIFRYGRNSPPDLNQYWAVYAAIP